MESVIVFGSLRLLRRRVLFDFGRRAREDRGYRKLFYDTVTQADKGVDFDFLRATQTRGVIPRR
jgi:hypothetical protein